VEWLKEQKDIKVIYNKENLGFPKGCNQGIKIATGEEILLLNNDTIVTPGWLENLRECLYSSEYIGAVGPVTNSCPNYQSIPVNYASVEEMIQFAEKYNYSESKNWEERLRLIGYCMLIKKEVIDKVGLLDEIFTPGNFEDDDYSFRMRKAGYKLMICNNSFIHHFGSASFEKKSKEFSELLIKNRKKFFGKWGFDPYHIVEIRKDITELIAKSDKEEINVLHIGCKGGGTLLDIKNSISSAMLYGIEEINEAFINPEYFTQVELGNVEKINKFKKNQFEFIITQSQESEEEIINILSSVKSYLRENGTIYMVITNEGLNSSRNLIKNLETRTDNYLFKSIKNNEEQILVIEKTKKNREDNICKLTIYKKQDIENINEECTLDYSQVESRIEEVLIRRLDNNLEFERNLNLFKELILNNKIDCEKVKDVVVNSSINKTFLLNIIAIVYYEYKFANETLMLLSEAFKLDGENKDTIYNIASVLLEAKENKMALDFLNGINNIDKDEDLLGLKQQIEEAI